MVSGKSISRLQVKRISEERFDLLMTLTGAEDSRWRRFARSRGRQAALVVGDAWQKQGIGHKLMDVLMDVARGRGLKLMEGEVLKTNQRMLKLVEGLGFKSEPHPEDDVIRRIVREL